MRETDKYNDIINMPHHVSSTRPRMSMHDRAAQFSPFAALTGYDDDVEEAARLTDSQIELTEDMKSVLNEKIQMIFDLLDDTPVVKFTYFVPDKRKEGGEYVSKTGAVKQIDEYEKCIVMVDKTIIPICMIIDIQGDIFK